MSNNERTPQNSPYDLSPAVAIDGYPFSFSIMTVREGFHQQIGNGYTYMKPGTYAKVEIGYPIPSQGFSEEVWYAIFDAVIDHVDNRVQMVYEDDEQLTPMNAIHAYPYGIDIKNGIYYIGINSPRPAREEDLENIPSELWGFPDRRLGLKVLDKSEWPTLKVDSE